MKSKQRGDGAILIFLIISLCALIGLGVHLDQRRMTLQEVQTQEQKCLQQEGTPEYKRFTSDSGVKKVLCKKDANLYEKF
jgi:hypothetical protein